MSNQNLREIKQRQRKKAFKSKNRYKGSDDKVFLQALEDSRRAIQWQEANPGKALPLGF